MTAVGDRVLRVDVGNGVAIRTLDPPADRDVLSRAMPAQRRSALGKGAPPGLADTEQLLGAARSAPLAGRFPDLPELSAHFSAGEEGREGMAACRGKRPARSVPA